jgi:GTP-binding protein
VGQTIRPDDLVINVCRTKHMTGHRAAPKAILDSLSPPRILTLDDAIEYLGNDELLEVTPDSLRIRKRELHHGMRQRSEKNTKRD